MLNTSRTVAADDGSETSMSVGAGGARSDIEGWTAWTLDGRVEWAQKHA